MLLYIFVNSSFVLFHHHKVSFSKPSVFIDQNHFDLEKSDQLQQDYHFSTAKIHCFFCDQHTVSFHQLNKHDYLLINEKNTLKTPIYNEGFTVLFLENTSNRDPPKNI